MPKSLDEGPSAIVPIKAPQGLRDLLREMLREGETISSVTRQLWVDEIVRRAAESKPSKRKKRRPKSG